MPYTARFAVRAFSQEIDVADKARQGALDFLLHYRALWDLENPLKVHRNGIGKAFVAFKSRPADCPLYQFLQVRPAEAEIRRNGGVGAVGLGIETGSRW